ncbi:MAG TPA: helix-turn-helix transcriptional regulator [Terriglobia bacterium]|nr:helix-turn-helix transcriptional regulator [Terriglobia bacterium]
MNALHQYRFSPTQGQAETITDNDTMAYAMKPVARYLEEKGIRIDELAAASGLDAKRVKAIVMGNYTPGPSERQRLAAALGIPNEEIAWGHAVPVEHLRGNGPQSGRST